jgi:hypothetical protein
MHLEIHHDADDTDRRVPISLGERFELPPTLCTQLLDLGQPHTSVILPTKQLKNLCLRLGPVRSLDDENPEDPHTVLFDLTPDSLTLSVPANPRGKASFVIHKHDEEGKDKVLIEFAPGHPKRFLQTHFLFCVFLFCRNQHPVSDYLRFAFAPGKTTVMVAEAGDFAYKLFHLVGVSTPTPPCLSHVQPD